MLTCMPTDVAVLQTTSQAASLLDETRLAILHHLRRPDSAAGVARQLGAPRQRIGYHVRALEAAGLLSAVGERRRGNTIERLLQSTATQYVVGPGALGAVGTSDRVPPDRFASAYLISAASRTISDVAALDERARAAGTAVPTLTIETEVRFATPAAQHAFARELAESLVELVRKHHDADAHGGRAFRFVVAGHPIVQRVEAREATPT
jgi:DNA-binding transcriptional ArsR family regulator